MPMMKSRMNWGSSPSHLDWLSTASPLRTASASCVHGRFQRSMTRIQHNRDSGLSSVRKRALRSVLA
ncbi:hypothetical protein G6F31_021969 [Rhizopus arrhizus]|nr:hypothetical protein G6F31_021969 [Rhizopus arrhizus]